jgi:hypothetical protein
MDGGVTFGDQRPRFFLRIGADVDVVGDSLGVRLLEVIVVLFGPKVFDSSPFGFG